MFSIHHRRSNEEFLHFIIFVNMAIEFNGSTRTPLFFLETNMQIQSLLKKNIWKRINGNKVVFF